MVLIKQVKKEIRDNFWDALNNGYGYNKVSKLMSQKDKKIVTEECWLKVWNKMNNIRDALDTNINTIIPIVPFLFSDYDENGVLSLWSNFL